MIHPSAATPHPAVIVVSSHVARGTVGNRAAVFALESLGFPVWAVPTVMLPWHPGHGPATRIVPDPQAFAALCADLAGSPWIGEVKGILTGYLGHPAQAAAIAGLVRAVKSASPDAIHICDPVLGDESGPYVPEATVAAIRDELFAIADVATPNRFELGWLTGRSGADHASLVAAARAAPPSTLVVTSAPAQNDSAIGNLLVTDREALLVEHRRYAKPPNGPGDLLAALLTAGLVEGATPRVALERAAASVCEVLERAAGRAADELMLETDAESLSRPAAATRTRTVE